MKVLNFHPSVWNNAELCLHHKFHCILDAVYICSSEIPFKNQTTKGWLPTVLLSVRITGITAADRALLAVFMVLYPKVSLDNVVKNYSTISTCGWRGSHWCCTHNLWKVWPWTPLALSDLRIRHKPKLLDSEQKVCHVCVCWLANHQC